MFKSLFAIMLVACSFQLSAFEPVGSGNKFKPVKFNSYKQTAPNEFSFKFPDISLIDQNNQSIKLDKLFNKDKNVVFAFFFTHCVSVCTTVTLSLKSIQNSLPADTTIAMISIDPETDTPDVLKTYAQRHQIDESNWLLLTGKSREIIDLQKSFEAYRGNKMNHSTSLYLKKVDSDVVTEVKTNFSIIPALINRS